MVIRIKTSEKRWYNESRSAVGAQQFRASRGLEDNETAREKRGDKERLKRSQLKRRRDLEGSSGKQDVVTALTNAQSTMIFGEFWQGSGVAAKKEIDHIFGKEKLKVGIVDNPHESNEMAKQ